jgi:hypothetical protein
MMCPPWHVTGYRVLEVAEAVIKTRQAFPGNSTLITPHHVAHCADVAAANKVPGGCRQGLGYAQYGQECT